MDKTDYNDKMDSLFNDKQAFEVLRRDPTPALQRKLNNKLLTLKKTDKIDFRRYNRLTCSVPQPEPSPKPKLYGLPKLHKPNIHMRPIISFCGSPTYQLSKYLTNVLKPLTDESRHKLQSTENLIDAIHTIQIPHDHKLVATPLTWNHCSPVFCSPVMFCEIYLQSAAHITTDTRFIYLFYFQVPFNRSSIPNSSILDPRSWFSSKSWSFAH